MGTDEDFLLELPIFLNWAGQRAPARDVFGLCSAALLTAIACPPTQLHAEMQVTHACLLGSGAKTLHAFEGSDLFGVTTLKVLARLTLFCIEHIAKSET